MYETVGVFEYIDYLRSRWRVVAAAAGCAFALSLIASWMLPKRYTSTASIVIEPPGGNDVRMATAVSPIYLESLKTYERFALSDSLFARAVAEFHLSDALPGQSLESMKKQVLKVTKIRDTKILEIDATLPDPAMAQKVAEFIANETVTLTRAETRAGDRDFLDEAQRQDQEAQAQLEHAWKMSLGEASGDSIEALQARIDSNVEVSNKLREELGVLMGDIAQAQERAKLPEGNYDAQQLPGLRARAAAIQARIDDLQRASAESGAQLSRRKARHDALEEERKLASTAAESTSARLRDLKASHGSRGERLRVIDPGVVPQRPSSPNILLNVSAAVFFALSVSMTYLALRFAYGLGKPVSSRAPRDRQLI